jgi:hypothetical protein
MIIGMTIQYLAEAELDIKPEARHAALMPVSYKQA